MVYSFTISNWRAPPGVVTLIVSPTSLLSIARPMGDVVEKLKAALGADYVVLGGGNAKLLKAVPPGARLGENSNAQKGGFRLFQNGAKSNAS